MKKLLSLLLFLTTYYFLLATPVFAVAGPTGGNALNFTWFAPDLQTWQQNTFGGDNTQMDGQKFGVFQITNFAQLLNSFMGGAKTLAYDQNGKPYYSYQGGAINFLAGVNSKMYTTSPASSVEYLADLGSNLGIKPAYAQGMGFNNLSPLLRLWKIFRDLTYLIFVIIFVAIGFMVMFRKKIDPRTVVTIQDALPQIVMALILTTFSYAIIGLLVDAMQFLSYLIINIILADPISGAKILNQTQTQTLLQSNIFELISQFFTATANLGASVSNVVVKAANLPAIAGLTSIGVDLIFKVTLFFTMFKIFFMLLGAYIQVILAVLFSPLQAALSAMPGGQSPFAWMKSLLSNLLVFPVTLLLFLIAFIFSLPNGGQLAGATLPNAGANNIKPLITWAPPLLGTWNTGGAGGLGPLISFGILLAIPAIGETIKQALNIKGGAAFGAGEKEFRGALGVLPVIGVRFKG